MLVTDDGTPLLGTRRYGDTVRIFGRVDRVSKEHALACIREWVPVLADRGKIQLWVSGRDEYVEFVKRCWKTRRDLLIFRYRNADATRESFTYVREHFDELGIDYQLALTKKTKRPRAIEVTLDPYDQCTPQAALWLVAEAFGSLLDDLSSFDVSCTGEVKSDADNVAVDVYIPPEVRERCEAWPGGEASQRLWSAVDRSLRRFAGLPKSEE